jgi:hypothetical protein
MLKISNENKKIGKDTLIINITSATDCPSKRLGLCNIEGNKCYALKAERLYPQVLPYRRAQERIWSYHTAQAIGDELVRIAKRRKRTPIRYIRFSEAGDFRNQIDVEKMKRVAQIVGQEGIVVYGYTARHDLYFNDLPPNMAINGSGFMVSNMFTAVKSVLEEEIVCPGNCRTCELCKTAKNLDIKVRYH